MAPGRSRGGRRNTSSYTSTITVIAFITLCMLGVWMLTSNSLAPPKTTTRTSETTATDDTEASLNQAQNTESVTKKDQHIYEDNPGDLPDDAIKSDEPKSNGEADVEGSNKEKREPEGHSNAVEEKVSLAGDKSRESTQEGKQGGEQTQISEESIVTQNQQAESIRQQVSESEGSQTSNEETRTNEEQGTTSQTSENLQDPETNRLGMDQNQNEEQQQQIIEDVGSSKSSQVSQNQIANEYKQEETLQEKDENSKNNQDPQNLEAYEKQQEQQRKEDAGTQSASQETQNEISEEDQQQRLKQQQGQQQQQQDKEMGESSVSSDNQNSQAFEGTTVKTYEDNEKSQGGEGNASQDTAMEEKGKDPKSSNSFPEGGNPGIPKESRESKKTWSTQASDSENQKERRKEVSQGEDGIFGYTWDLCNNTAGPDYIPCLDNEKALRKLRTTRHFEHRERHCPEVGPTCLVPLPEGYKTPVSWPQSRDKIWYHNVPHTSLAEVKGHQNWLKVSGEFLTFPGGGTQFIHGAMHYIEFVEKAVPNIAWGKHTRVILDVGCGVASFGGYLFEKDVLAMSFAPKDEHEAQVQFALERGIPAISAVMGSQRLPFPSRVFDLIHCARCRVPWHAEGGLLLLELNRVLRPGGYFVWSATPVYQKLEEDVEIWQAMSALTVTMCWELVTIKKDKLNSVGAAIYRKPTTNDCYDQRKKKSPPICKSDDDPSASWYVPLQACMHRVPTDENERGSGWPEDWPRRLQTPPYWLNNSQMGIYGRPAPDDFMKDYVHWRNVVNKSYLKGFGISWDNVRNVMDMRAVYGGFAAALRDHQVWVLNVVNVDSPDTLPIIYERGLIGIYHDWCESFSTYPRTYDLLHADHLFSLLRKRCKLAPVMAEIDRIVRPGGKIIIRDESIAIGEVENLLKSLRWEVHLTFSKDQEGLLSAQKGNWRPVTYESTS